MMGNAFGIKSGRLDQSANYQGLQPATKQSVVIPPGSTEGELGKMPRCLRNDYQPPMRYGGTLLALKQTFGLHSHDPLTGPLPQQPQQQLLPPPIPKSSYSLASFSSLRSAATSAQRWRTSMSALVAVGVSAGGLVTMLMDIGPTTQRPSESKPTFAQADTRTTAYAGGPQAGETDRSKSRTTQAKSVQDLQLATTTVGDAFDGNKPSTGVLAAVTHNFAPAHSSRDFARVKSSPILIPTGPARLVETLANPAGASPVPFDAVFAVPASINAPRGSRQILPILLASPKFAEKIRTVVITGLPSGAKVTAASRNGQGGWVLVPEALGIAELILPGSAEGVSELTVTGFGDNSLPLGISNMRLAIAAPNVSPEDLNKAHKSIAEGLVLFEQGDVDGARGMLSAVVDMGNAHAAFVFAETFDPAGLANRGLDGAKADIERARFWYKRAHRGGNAMAAARLARLPAPKQEVIQPSSVSASR